ncbi:deoxycytidine triphosphate deaminase [Allomuricauda sp. d1]|uniref:dCTP deaminase domain-containing protein n=1 Tax=Allomuricauda sp. d1 TaxID=3136725 RepID=UPI0031DAA25C
MAFLANKELKKELPKIIVEGYIEQNIKHASYELLLGDEIYANNDSTKTILNENNSQFELKPGQFALLMTKETLNIPTGFIGFISLKFGFKKRGLVNISGFHVDPGFKGRLKFSVYNAGSKSIILQRGKPYFMIWLSELTSKLSKEEAYGDENEHQDQNQITPDDIMTIHGEIASPNELLYKINSLDSKIELVGSEVKSKKERNWWGIRIIIGILIGIALKVFWDWCQYKNGYQDAMEKVETDNRQINDLKNEMFEYIDIQMDSIKRDSIK